MARQPVGLVAQPREPLPAAGQRGVARLGGRLAVALLGRVAPVDHRLPLRGAHRERRRHPRVGVVDGGRRAAGLEAERGLHVARHAAHRPRLRPARRALELARRQAEHLAQLADRPARAEGRERGHQRRALGPVALVDARDQHLADVAREVQVDVGQRGELLVEEAPEEQLVLDRVDVREAGEVADDRGHRGAAAAPGRQQRARRVRPPHLDRHVARELQQVAVQDEEAGQPERLDHAQLLFEARVRVGVAGVLRRIALVHLRPAQLRQRAAGARVLGARVAVAEVGVQVEAQAVGQLQRLRDRLGVVLEAGGHRGRRGEHVREVAAPDGLGGVQRRVVAQRHERVLQRGARARVRVDVAGRHARDPQPRRHRGQPAVERAVVALERALELHPQAVGAEGGQQPPHRRLVAHALARAAAQADQALRRAPRPSPAARPAAARASGACRGARG